jgi:hypothetical protein
MTNDDNGDAIINRKAAIGVWLRRASVGIDARKKGANLNSGVTIGSLRLVGCCFLGDVVFVVAFVLRLKAE